MAVIQTWPVDLWSGGVITPCSWTIRKDPSIIDCSSIKWNDVSGTCRIPRVQHGWRAYGRERYKKLRFEQTVLLDLSSSNIFTLCFCITRTESSDIGRSTTTNNDVSRTCRIPRARTQRLPSGGIREGKEGWR